MNPNLIPTVIVNKNGVTTTVHKKPPTAPSAKTKLPTPAAPATPAQKLTPEQRNKLISEIQTRITELYTPTEKYRPGESESEMVRRFMLKSTDNAITAMHEYVMGDLKQQITQYQGQPNPEYERRVFLGWIGDHTNRTTPHNVHEYITYRDSISLTLIDSLKPARPAFYSENPLLLLDSLHGYTQLPTMDNYAEADPETQTQIAALLTVTDKLYIEYFERLHERYKKLPQVTYTLDNPPPPLPTPMELGVPLSTEGKYISDTKSVRLLGDSLINLVTKHPDRANDIAEHILTRGADTNHLWEVFDTPAPSLQSGIL